MRYCHFYLNTFKSDGAQGSWLHHSTLATSEVNKDTVTEQSEHYEVDGWPHAVLNTSLWADSIIHHLVPVLTSQNLQVIKGTEHIAEIITQLRLD